MSNYVGEAAAYSAKVSAFQASVSQITSSLSAQEAKLSDIPESSLKSNVSSSIKAIKLELENIVSEAQANASKLYSKARELDEANRKKAIQAMNHNSNLTENSEDNKEENALDNKLNEDNNPQQEEKTIDVHIGEVPGNGIVIGNNSLKPDGISGVSPYV